MPITGRLMADFSDFSRAVESAEVELRGMETNANKVGAGLNRMVDQFSGRKLIQEAVLAAEAIEELGGASKLTEKELKTIQLRAEEAVEKLKALGQDVPPQLEKLAASTREAADEVEELDDAAGGTGSAVGKMGDELGDVDDVLQQMGIDLGPIPKALEQFGVALDTPIEKLGLLKTAGLAAGAAFAGWQVGRMIADFAGTDKIIGDATAKLLGWGDVAAEEAAAGADVLARASKAAGREITNLDEAIRINTKTATDQGAAMKRLGEEQTARQKQLEEDTKKLTELNRSLFGQDVIEKGALYVEALGDVSNATLLTTDKKKELHEAVGAALEAYKALGQQAPADMLRVFEATQKTFDLTKELAELYKQKIPEMAGLLVNLESTITPLATSLKGLIIEPWKALGGTTREELQKAATEAQTKYEQILSMHTHFSDAQIANARRAAEEAQRAADAWGGATIAVYEAVGDAARATADVQVAEARRVTTETIAEINRLGAASMPLGGAGGSLPNVNPFTGEGMAGTDPLVQGYLREGYTLGEAIAKASGQGAHIGPAHGTWTAAGWIETGRGAAWGAAMVAPANAVTAGGVTIQTLNVNAGLSQGPEVAAAIKAALTTDAMARGTRIPVTA